MAELKTLTDANSASLDGTGTTFTNILLSNESISDISSYLTTEVTEDSTLYDPILKAVLNLVMEYITAARGGTFDQETDMKLDGVSVAKIYAAINIGFNNLDLSSFTSTESSALKTAIVDSIYSTSGFKYNGVTTISSNNIVYDRTIDTDALAYENQLYPATKGPFGNLPTNTHINVGTSGADTFNFDGTFGASAGTSDHVYQALAGDDVVTISLSGHHQIFGGTGNDTIKETVGNDSSNDFYSGGPGDDKLAVRWLDGKKLQGGSGNDVFILDYNTASARAFDANVITFNDEKSDSVFEWQEANRMPALIVDFEQGVDKIGLRNGNDWDGKTIIAIQGTGSLANHTLLIYG